MPTAETLRALIALVEEAKAGSRELDAIVWYTLVEKPRPGDKLDLDIIGKWPAYTTSIDAALALVAKVLLGWSLQLGMDEGYRYPSVIMGRSYPTNKSVAVEHHTSALTIIYAMLKALLIEAEETAHVER